VDGFPCAITDRDTVIAFFGDSRRKTEKITEKVWIRRGALGAPSALFYKQICRN